MRKLLSLVSEYGVFLLAFLLPLGTRYILATGTVNGFAWEYATVSIFALEVLIWLLIITTTISHLIDFDDEAHFRNQKAYIIILLLIGLGVLSLSMVYFAYDRFFALLGALHLIEGIALVFVLMHAKFSLHRLAQCVVGSAVIQAVIGITQFSQQYISSSTLFGISEKLPSTLGISVVMDGSERVLRAYGTFSHPNIFGFFMVMGIMCALGLLFTFRSAIEKRIVLLTTIILSTGLFFTFSRSAYVALAVSLCTVLLYTIVNKSKTLRRSLLIFLSIFVITQALLGVTQKDILISRISPEVVQVSTSVSERSVLVAQARTLIETHWNTGVGVGNYAFVAKEAFQDDAGVVPQPVHNIFLLIIVELGLAGGLFIIFLLYEILRRIVTLKVEYSAVLLAELEKIQQADMYESEYGYTTHWYIIFSSLFLAALSVFFFDHYFWTLIPGIIMFWFIVGMWLRQFVRVKV